MIITINSKANANQVTINFRRVSSLASKFAKALLKPLKRLCTLLWIFSKQSINISVVE